MLNAANGFDPAPAGDAISRANTLLGTFSGKLPYAIAPSTQPGQAMVAIGKVLAQYNPGSLTPGCLQFRVFFGGHQRKDVPRLGAS